MHGFEQSRLQEEILRKPAADSTTNMNDVQNDVQNPLDNYVEIC
jgi:hypothetical protein